MGKTCPACHTSSQVRNSGPRSRYDDSSGSVVVVRHQNATAAISRAEMNGIRPSAQAVRNRSSFLMGFAHHPWEKFSASRKLTLYRCQRGGEGRHTHEPRCTQDGILDGQVVKVLPGRSMSIGLVSLDRASSHQHEAPDAMLGDGVINEGVHGRGWIGSLWRDEVDGGYLSRVIIIVIAMVKRSIVRRGIGEVESDGLYPSRCGLLTLA
jgi:hypothetical protein